MSPKAICEKCGHTRLTNIGMVGLLTYYDCNNCHNVQSSTENTWRTEAGKTTPLKTLPGQR